MIQFGVQREGAAHVRDRLTLRLLRIQHTAATADYLMVFTAAACRSDPRTADTFWISRHYLCAGLMATGLLVVA
jgi:hypothetical protein